MNDPEYFWKDGKVIEISDGGTILDVPSFEPMTDDPLFRYGVYTSPMGWESCTYEELPAEFRAHLLLMGVPA